MSLETKVEWKAELVITQVTSTCLKSTIEILE